MITYQEALKIIYNCSAGLNTEIVNLPDALGRVLAQDVMADIDMPPFDKAAVDGYACRMEDIGNELELIALIAAGQHSDIIIGRNQCAKIMTGAPVPTGADCVLLVEETENVREHGIRFTKTKTAINICYRGEDANKGDVVFKKDLLIHPQHIAVMAAFGCIEPLVSRKIRIAILSTGDELVEPRVEPLPSQIRNSNASQLVAQASRLPAIINYLGIVGDVEENMSAAFADAINDNDLLLITGGISMGDYDLVPDVLLKMGFRFHFRSLAMQPGRPTIFGTNPDGKVCFALPGNPVSSFSQFELLVKPAIYKMMGHHFSPAEFQVSLAHGYQRKKTERLALVPVRINNNGEAEIIDYHGSAHISALTNANALMFVEQGIAQINKGEKVRVRQI